jgi:hypothetical protein
VSPTEWNTILPELVIEAMASADKMLSSDM